MVCRVKIKNGKIKEYIVINGCNDCLFNDKIALEGKGYCELLRQALPRFDNTSIIDKCPLFPQGKRVEISLWVHSYTCIRKFGKLVKQEGCKMEKEIKRKILVMKDTIQGLYEELENLEELLQKVLREKKDEGV